ncbi:MAG TPA: hypothetical protein EYO90_12455 [Candidatus Latescibacteria bacterium]|nr:hypothetical protein [Candidatus Latescibacterota bacterium]
MPLPVRPRTSSPRRRPRPHRTRRRQPSAVAGIGLPLFRHPHRRGGGGSTQRLVLAALRAAGTGALPVARGGAVAAILSCHPALSV